MKFATQWNPNLLPPERGGGPILVETSGYRDTQTMISELMLSGARLQAARMEEFDYPENVEPSEDAEPDPTRAPDFDMADMSVLTRKTKRKLLLKKQLSDQQKKDVEKLKKANESAKSDSGSMDKP